jgi:hypothetical protein
MYPHHPQLWQNGFTLTKCGTSFLGTKLQYLAERKTYCPHIIAINKTTDNKNSQHFSISLLTSIFLLFTESQKTAFIFEKVF